MIYTEEKAKVVAASWGIEVLQYLAASYFAPGRVGEKGDLHPIFQLVLVQNS